MIAVFVLDTHFLVSLEGEKKQSSEIPETGEGAEHGSSSHSHCKTHHEAHLHPVKTAGLGLTVRTYSYRHLEGRHEQLGPVGDHTRLFSDQVI